MKTTTTLVVLAAPGLVKKGLGKFVNCIPGNINIWETQKIALLGIHCRPHTVQSVLQTKLSEEYINPNGTMYMVQNL